MAKLFFAANAVTPTTAVSVAVTTGTAIKSMLQVATPSTATVEVVEWGISFNGSAAATPIKVELLQCDVAASVTSVTPTIWTADPTVSLCVGGASATGHTSSAEGSITATKVFDLQYIAPTNQYVKQYPLDRGPIVAVSRFLRIRLHAAAAVDCYCYIIWAE